MNDTASTPLPFVFGLTFRIGIRHHSGVDIFDPTKAKELLDADVSAAQEYLFETTGMIAKMEDGDHIREDARVLVLDTLWVRSYSPEECTTFLKKVTEEENALLAKIKLASSRIDAEGVSVCNLPPVGLQIQGDQEEIEERAQDYLEKNIAPYLDVMKESSLIGSVSGEPPRSFAIVDISRLMNQRYLIQPHNRTPEPEQER